MCGNQPASIRGRRGGLWRRLRFADSWRFASCPSEDGVLSFPPFRLDPADERLWRDEQEIPLRRKPFAILRYFVEHPQRLVTHDELVEAVWGKVAMSESLLRTHVRELRQAVGEGMVETVVGRGYRFVAKVAQFAES